MELKWLDDYIALIETGTFSGAAERRHVSQPAFSRRIQALENWLGVTLIDRSRKPLHFTPVALENEDALRILVARIYEFRALLKSDALEGPDITIAAQHSLTASYVPGLLQRLRLLSKESERVQNFRIRSENRSESIALLMRGDAQILVTYETPVSPCAIPAQMAKRHILGEDELMLVAAPALHQLLQQAPEGARVPLLCFPPDSFFGHVVRAEAMPELMRRQQVVVRCVSEYAMGLRELALMGQGIAWLPGALIAEDLAKGNLRPMPAIGRSVPMKIVVYFSLLTGAIDDELMAKFDVLCSNLSASPENLPDNERIPSDLVALESSVIQNLRQE